MKIKLLILSAVLSLALAFGFACGETSESVESSPSTESTGIIESEGSPIISLNQNKVKICIGEKFTLSATAKNISNAEFTWSLDGDSSADVISFEQKGNDLLITPLKLGKVKLVATLTVDGIVYFESAEVEVVEKNNVAIVLSDVGFDDDGYFVELSTLAEDGHISQMTAPLISVYVDNKINNGVTPVWTSADESVLSVSDNMFKALKEGETVATVTCEIAGKTYSTSVKARVYRPQIALDEKFAIEVENLSDSYAVSANVKGGTAKVTYQGNEIGSYDFQRKEIVFNKKSLPVTAKNMGENREILIETDKASYSLSVDFYTKIITTKEEFNAMATLAKNACPKQDNLWDGYFVLGADIEYDGVYKSRLADLDSLWAAVGETWSNGVMNGFKGVFDGKGHQIDGVEIDNGKEVGGVFGVLNVEGLIKNVSFTNASVSANASLVCSTGAGSIENIYVSFKSMGKGVQRYEGDGSISNYCSAFFGYKEPTLTANATNCVIDVTNAKIDKSASIKAVGSEHVTYKNVFVIGGSYELRAKSNATMTFGSIAEFVEDATAQSRYKKFDTSPSGLWSGVGGVPVSKSVYNNLKDDVVEFNASESATVTSLVVGTQYKFKLTSPYAVVTSNSEHVTVEAGVATILPSATQGESVTFTATSLFNGSEKTFTCSIVKFDLEMDRLDLTTEEENPDGYNAFYDITVDKVYFAELSDKVSAKDILYYVNEDYTYVTYLDDGKDTKKVIGVAKDKLYLFNCQSVTKVISEKEDLHYIRRDYTVQVGSIQGMYDGVIVGTYVLINDIDCTGLTLKNTGTFYENSRGFGGVFDGRNYTIKNLTVGANGLFGVLCNGTIKDVNFENVYLKASNKEGTDGSYVALFAASVYNSTFSNVTMHFASYVAGNTLYHTSGLMFYEKSFDSTFTDIEIDISDVTGVKYLTELYYDQTLTGTSKEKSVYKNVIVYVNDIKNKPVFAYNYKAVETATNPDELIKAEEYPEGITFIEKKADDNK